VEQLIKRVGTVEDRVWRHEEVLSNHGARLASLETSRDNERARHSSTPAWIYGSISAFVGLATLLFTLYLAGVRP
jgi:hypothetical protein